jgi:plasmid stabilization system protein ParE
MARLIWSAQAIADLEKARELVRGRSAIAARRLVAEIIEAADRLERFPALGRPGPVDGVRTLVVARSRFLLDYAVRDDVVEIIAVTDGPLRR